MVTLCYGNETLSMAHADVGARLSHACRCGPQPKREIPTYSKNCRDRSNLLSRKKSGVSQMRLLKVRVKTS